MFKKTLVAALIGIPLLISSGCERTNTVYQGKFKGYDIEIRDVIDYDFIRDPISQKRVVSFKKDDKLFHLIDRKMDGSIDYIYVGKFDSDYEGEIIKDVDPLNGTILDGANRVYKEILEQASKHLFN